MFTTHLSTELRELLRPAIAIPRPRCFPSLVWPSAMKPRMTPSTAEMPQKPTMPRINEAIAIPLVVGATEDGGCCPYGVCGYAGGGYCGCCGGGYCGCCGGGYCGCCGGG